MTNETLYELIGEIRDEKIQVAKVMRTSRKARIKKYISLAACVCLVVGIAIPTISYLFKTISNTLISSEDADGYGRPFISIKGVHYIDSSRIIVHDELPEGFSYAGETDLEVFKNCPYYTNPDIPEYIYVYHEVLTNGEIDSTGTIIRTEPHDAYVRYVDERLHSRDIICFDGNYYISMWSAYIFGDNPDVTKEYYDEMEDLYGIRVEGEVPDGFKLAGLTEFTGYDAVPKGYLSSNNNVAKVYFNPDNPSVIYSETYWFTHTALENKEIRHEGYDVYILYDCPFDTNNE